MTETIHSSFRLYYENREAPLHFVQTDFVNVPCAVAQFPKEIYAPPRVWVERGYNISRWSEMPRGGHFAAAERKTFGYSFALFVRTHPNHQSLHLGGTSGRSSRLSDSNRHGVKVQYQCYLPEQSHTYRCFKQSIGLVNFWRGKKDFGMSAAE